MCDDDIYAQQRTPDAVAKITSSLWFINFKHFHANFLRILSKCIFYLFNTVHTYHNVRADLCKKIELISKETIH